MCVRCFFVNTKIKFLFIISLLIVFNSFDKIKSQGMRFSEASPSLFCMLFIILLNGDVMKKYIKSVIEHIKNLTLSEKIFYTVSVVIYLCFYYQHLEFFQDHMIALERIIRSVFNPFDLYCVGYEVFAIYVIGGVFLYEIITKKINKTSIFINYVLLVLHPILFFANLFNWT